MQCVCVCMFVELVGDDPDVVMWESIMNDHGTAVKHAFENHMRNAISLPRRPLYHVLVAGKRNGGTHWDKNHGLYHKELIIPQYIDFGSGHMQFQPSYGLNPIDVKKSPNFSKGNLYVSWHPGPFGARMYAEIIAYEYLTSLLRVLEDIEIVISTLDVDGKPIEEMLEILEDPPRTRVYLSENGIGGQCEPLCTNASTSYCLSGYQPLADDIFSLYRWQRNPDCKWKYQMIAGNSLFVLFFVYDCNVFLLGNSQALWYGSGGQAANDLRYAFIGDSNSGTLDIYMKSSVMRYVLLNICCKPKGMGFNEVLVFELYEILPKFNFVSALECLMQEENKDLWSIGLGCVLQVPKQFEKYLLKISLKANVKGFSGTLKVEQVQIH